MGLFINTSDLPALDVAEAAQLIADVEALALQRVPELANVPSTAATLAAFRSIVMRWKIEGPAAVVSQTTGPYGLGLDTRRVGWKLSADELSTLRELAGAGSTSGTGAQGYFPEPGIDQVFDGGCR